MKKCNKAVAATAVSVLMLSMVALSGCSKNEADIKYLKDFNANDYVELGEYKGLTVDVDKVSVDDAEVEDYVQYYLEANAIAQEVTGRDIAQKGDVANIDYEGKKDGVAFDGGTAQDYDLTLGLGTFIPGFEDGVVGMKVGESKDIDLTFPESYASEELAGADVTFTVKLNSIKEMKTPELNDELVKKIAADTGATYQTVDEFRAAIKQELIDGYQQDQDTNIENQLEEKIFATSTFKEAPSGLVERLTQSLLDSIEEASSAYGVEPSVVASYYYGISDENYEEGIKNYAKETLVPNYIMMCAIAQKEGIEVDDKTLDEEMQKTIDSYGLETTIDEYKEMIGDVESFREYVVIDKTVEFLKENAIINEN